MKPKQRQPRELLNSICGHLLEFWHHPTLNAAQKEALTDAYNDAEALWWDAMSDPKPKP